MKALGLGLLITLLAAGCASPPPPADENFDRAAVDIIKGGFPPGRQPDGNTIVLASSAGLIVFDTGRHIAHTQKIIDLADARRQPIAAIVNSHWHLDHISGNIPLRARFPGAAVYSNGASLDLALRTELPEGRASNQELLKDPTTTPEIIDEIAIDAATVDQGEKLRPTVSIEHRQTLVIGGRTLDVHTASGASDGDIWIFDPATKLVMMGDLVTFPAPFLDTPCPAAWSRGLDEVLATPFVRAVPGHGREMTRADVALYRDAFNALIACANGSAEPLACAEAWADAASPLQENPETDRRYARGMARNYVENVLRKGGVRKDCTG